MNKRSIDAVNNRFEAERKVIAALNHLPRSQALSVIMGWIPIDELVKALPTICGSEAPVEDPVEAFAHRLKIACIHRQIQPVIIHARDNQFTPKGKKSRAQSEIDGLLKEAIKEAIS